MFEVGIDKAEFSTHQLCTEGFAIPLLDLRQRFYETR